MEEEGREGVRAKKNIVYWLFCPEKFPPDFVALLGSNNLPIFH